MTNRISELREIDFEAVELVFDIDYGLCWLIKDNNDGSIRTIRGQLWKCSNCGTCFEQQHKPKKCSYITPDGNEIGCGCKKVERITPELPDDNLWEIPEYENNYQPDLYKLYNNILQILKKMIVFQKEIEYKILALWIIASWKLESFNSVPFPMFIGETHSGKTKTLMILSKLCYRGIIYDSDSTFDVMKINKEYKPTLLIDEADDTLKINTFYGKQLNVFVKNSYKRNNPTDFSFKSFAGVKQFPYDVMERMLIFHMKESIPEIEDMQYLDIDIDKIRQDLLQYKYNIEMSPDLGNKFIIHGRPRELFECLFSVALHIGLEIDDIYQVALEYEQRIKHRNIDNATVQILTAIKKGNIILDDILKTVTYNSEINSMISLGMKLKEIGIDTKRKRIDGKLKTIIDKNKKLEKIYKNMLGDR